MIVRLYNASVLLLKGHLLMTSHIFGALGQLFESTNPLISTKLEMSRKRHLFVCLFVSEDAKKEDVESGPEEEEVPTRGFLKRQANMIVDAKSRSKRGNRRR